MSDAVPAKKTTAAKASQAKATKGETTRKRKEYAPLNVAAIKAQPVTSRETMVKHRNTKGERSAEQIAVDKLVKQAHDRWVSAGKPQNWLNSNTGYLIELANDQLETFMFMVRKAATYYDVAVRFGKEIQNGDSTQLVFIAKDKPVKDAEASESEDD